MEVLVRDHGVNSFKVVLSALKDSEAYAVLEACKQLGALAVISAENPEIFAEVGVSNAAVVH